AGAAVQGGDGIAAMLTYVIENITHILERRLDKVDMRSDRLFWFLYSASVLLNNRTLEYRDFLSKLSDPEYRERISRHQLLFMLHDYVDAMETAHAQSSLSLWLLLEAATVPPFPDLVKALLQLLIKMELPTVVPIEEVCERAAASTSARGDTELARLIA